MIDFAQSFNDYSSISSFLHEQTPTHCLISHYQIEALQLQSKL